MKRVLALLAVIVALTSLVVPSIAVGGRGLASHPTPTYVLTAQGTYVGGPCLLKPGKGQACPRPDLGILPARLAPRTLHRAAERPRLADAMPTAPIVEPTLRPPRGC